MITVTINSVDRTNDIAKFSLQLLQRLSKEPAVVKFSIVGKKTMPELGDQVTITEDSVAIFTGTITERHATSNGNVMVGYSFVCVDGYYEFDRKLIKKAYQNQTLGEIAQGIIDESGSSITLSVTSPSPTIKTARFNYEQPSRCIQKLANQVGWDWYIDSSNVLHLFPEDTTPAPFEIEDNNGTVIANSLEFNSNITELQNVVWVRGGEYEDPIEEENAVDVYVADGEQKAFPLVYRYSEVQITLDDVAQSVGVDYLGKAEDYDCLYNYQEKLVKFPDGTLTGGEVVKVYGNAKVPLIVQAQDDDSVTAYGIREGVEINKSIDSIQEAEMLADTLLDKWREGSMEGSFRTRETGLRVGQTIHITSDRFGIDAKYKVNRITGAIKQHGEFEYTVEFITSGQTTLTDILVNLLGRDNQNIEISPDEVIQRFKKLNDAFGIGDEIVEMTKNAPPYHYGPVTTGNEARYNFATYT